MFDKNRLVKLRKEAGLIQSEVATKLNVKRETYTRYENGTISPPSDMVVAIAQFYDVSADYLLGITDDPTPPSAKKEEPTYEVGSDEWVRQLLEKRGILKEGEDLTDEQLKIALANLENLVRLFKHSGNE